MNAERVIRKINIEMNAFNESGGREDKACAEGLRRARTYIQKEVLKRKILTNDQQIVLKWLKDRYLYPLRINPIGVIFALHNELVEDSEDDVVEAYEFLNIKEELQVLQTFTEWALEQEEE